LIELLVVVLIIGILAAIALPKYLVSVERSRADSALITLSSLERAMMLYVDTHGYPSQNTGTDQLWDNLDFNTDLPYQGNGYRCDDNFRYSLTFQTGIAYIQAQRLIGKSKTCGGYPSYSIMYAASRGNKLYTYKRCNIWSYGNAEMQYTSKQICNMLLNERLVTEIKP